jgi:hypothetical protein
VPDINVPFPIRGISDVLSRDRQLPLTTRDATNVRAIDPITRQARGAQRAGYSKFIEPRLGRGPVQAIRSVVVDRSQIEYTALEDGQITIEWSKESPSNGSVVDLSVTTAGDVYAAADDGSVIRYNQSGSLVSSTAVSLETTDEKPVAIAAAPDGAVYVATGRASGVGGRVIKYTVQEDRELEQAWSYDAGSNVAGMAWSGARLYVTLNDADAEEASAICLDNLTATAPTVLWEQAAPYPVGRVVVNSDGDAVVAFEPRGSRGEPATDSAGLFETPSTFDFDPADNDDSGAIALYSWFRGEDFADQPNGSDVGVWLDRANGRDLLQVAGYAAPRVRRNAFPPPASRTGVRFSQDRGTGLQSGGGNANAWPMQVDTDFFVTLLVAVYPDDRDTPDGRLTLFESGGKPYFRADVGFLPAASTPGNGPLRQVNIAMGYPAVNDANWYSASYDYTSGNYVDFSDALTPQLHLVTIALKPGGAANSSMIRLNGVTKEDFACPAGISAAGLPDRNSGKPLKVGWSFFSDDHFNGDIIEMLCYDGTYVAPAADGSGTSAIEQAEGYLAHANGVYGSGGVLASTHSYYTTAPDNGGTNPTDPTGGFADHFEQPFGGVMKLSALQGSIRWMAAGGGMGLGVAVDSDDNVYSVGPRVISGQFNPSEAQTKWGAITWANQIHASTWQSTNESYRVVKLIDSGSSVSKSATGSWQNGTLNGTSGEDLNASVGIAVDVAGRIYIPLYPISGTGIGSSAIECLDGSDGSAVFDVAVPGATDSGLVVAPDTFAAGAGSGGVTIPEFAYVGTLSPNEVTLHQIRLAAENTREGAPRETHVIAVSGGDVYRITREQSPFARPVSGGRGAISRDSRNVQIAALQQRLFCVDGQKAFYYEPKDNGGLGSVQEWRATNGGVLPKQPRLLASWHGRLLLARTIGEPHNVYASKMGDAFDWEYFDEVPTALSAWALNASDIGEFPDVVQTLIPVTDDILIVGCTNSIHALLGDPRLVLRTAGDPTGQPGTRIEITDRLGMAFGKSWTLDDRGGVYFVGDDGGVYYMGPPYRSYRAIDGNIRDRLLDRDWSQSTIRPVWDHRVSTAIFYDVPVGLTDDEAGVVAPDTVTMTGGDAVEYEFAETSTMNVSLFWYRQEGGTRTAKPTRSVFNVFEATLEFDTATGVVSKGGGEFYVQWHAPAGTYSSTRPAVQFHTDTGWRHANINNFTTFVGGNHPAAAGGYDESKIMEGGSTNSSPSGVEWSGTLGVDDVGTALFHYGVAAIPETHDQWFPTYSPGGDPPYGWPPEIVFDAWLDNKGVGIALRAAGYREFHAEQSV